MGFEVSLVRSTTANRAKLTECLYLSIFENYSISLAIEIWHSSDWLLNAFILSLFSIYQLAIYGCLERTKLCSSLLLLISTDDWASHQY
jgi:hypothetical protein